MNVNDIVFLKSSKEKLMITWLVGVTEKQNFPVDFNKILMMRPDYQPGDIAVEYGKGKKATIPGNCLIGNLTERVHSTNQTLIVGNVVKHKLTEEEMTIIWVVGQETFSSNEINLNTLYLRQGYEDGDIVCAYFEKKEYKTTLFKSGQVEKVYE